ncbi:ventricular zone-expressed PH domain-containing protein homolog 1-like [Mya arenaria]|uniref:ventricular zone-expressed PH domain-containing protein homolog 1-like n=1 Tax=Mya arenaria TaxID=6604 RepID=UPI0022E2507D|nr:ventricular zone-expressed PH domain-containing protein homolog 1-like [Mya arenaria]
MAFNSQWFQSHSWLHYEKAQSASALSQQDLSVSSLKHCWDALYPEKGNSGYITLVTSSFPSAKDQDALLQELHGDRYFDVFEFNAPRKYWACFMCNHPEKMSELMPDGSPVIAGQLKEKKGRWKFLKRWKTRYFTLSGSQITYSKSDSRKETLPVREIQSVKAVRKGIRDIP